MNDVPVVVVTGGAQGIGRAIGDMFADRGHHVIAGDLQAGDLAADADADPGPGLSHAPLDVTAGDAVGAFFDRVVDRHGRLDAVVNNAGIQHHAPILELALGDWRRVLEVNLHGVFACLQAAGRHMVAAGSGAIVNISSVSARGSAGRAPYSTSKAALAGLTATAAAEWAAAGVRVNSVAPGYVDTGVFRQGVAAGTLDLDRVLGRVPAGRLADPDQVAEAVVWLCSPAAGYVTGHTMFVDGGFMVDYGIPLVEPGDNQTGQ